VINFEKLKRTGQVTLPSLFTVANVAFGFFSLLAAADREFSKAGWCIIGAMAMDALDGRVARLVHGESKFGVEIDSLADFLSFGIAPACLLYFFQLKDYGFWGAPVAFVYALCGALRLARFNVLSHEGKSSKQYFSGLPIPAAAGILASFVIAYSLIETNGGARSLKIVRKQLPAVYSLIPFIMLGLGILMVSKVPYAAFKQSNLLRPRTLRAVLFAVALLFVVIKYPQDALFMVFTLYAVSGVIAVLWHASRNLGGSAPRAASAEMKAEESSNSPRGIEKEKQI